MVWSRLLPKPSRFRLLSKSLITSHLHSSTSSTFLLLNRPFSTNNNNNNNNNNRDRSSSNIWQLSGENEAKFDAFFSQNSDTSLAGIADSPVAAKGEEEDSWLKDDDIGRGGDIFARIEKYEIKERSVSGIDGGGGDEWLNSSLEEKPWSFEEVEKEAKVFDFGENAVRSDDGDIDGGENVPSVRNLEEEKMLEKEKEDLNAILKGKQAIELPFYLFIFTSLNE